MALGRAEALGGAMKEMERIAIRLRALAADRPDGWKNEYVALRRDLHPQLRNVEHAGEVCLAGGGGELATAFRNAVHELRHALSLHHAEWPVVCIDVENADYRASMMRVQNAHRTLNRVAEQAMRLE